MNDLIAKLEALTGPCREMDARIRAAVYAPESAYVEQSPINGAWCIFDGFSVRSNRPRIWEGKGWGQSYTTSIDAAMTLVPEGCLAMMKMIWDDADKPTEKAVGYASVDQYFRDEGGLMWKQNFLSLGATPAIALCIAALKARGV